MNEIPTPKVDDQQVTDAIKWMAQRIRTLERELEQARQRENSVSNLGWRALEIVQEFVPVDENRTDGQQLEKLRELLQQRESLRQQLGEANRREQKAYENGYSECDRLNKEVVDRMIKQRDVALGCMYGDEIPDEIVKEILGPGTVTERWYRRKTRAENVQLRAQNEALRELVSHAWVHSGYPCSGYKQMTTEQKKLYCEVIGAEFHPLRPNFVDDSKS